jgi:gas vesicle protein
MVDVEQQAQKIAKLVEQIQDEYTNLMPRDPDEMEYEAQDVLDEMQQVQLQMTGEEEEA